MHCPAPLFKPYGGGCIHGCPSGSRVIEERTDGGQARCVYKPDPTKYVNLSIIGGIPYSEDFRANVLPWMYDVEQKDPARYQQFKAEEDRVSTELNELMDSIDKQTKIDDAFKTLQAAENNRDKAPDAYERARIAYYTLLRGEEWIETEKERVTKAEVDPEVAKYRTAYDDIASRQNAQQQTQDAMNSVKDGVLSLKDDFQYTTNLFKDQIENLKNQINMERRGREKSDGDEKGFFPWVDLILNFCIIAGLIFAGLTFWRKLYYRPSPFVSSPTGFFGPRLPYV